MNRDKIFIIILILLIIFSLSLIEADVLKIKKSGDIQLIKMLETRIRLYFTLSIFLLIIFFIFLIIELRRGVKREKDENITPILKVFETYQLKEKELKEKSEKERKRAEEARLLYSTLFENSKIGILIIDEFGRIENYNNTAKDILFKGKSIGIFTKAELCLPEKVYFILKEREGKYFEEEIEYEGKNFNISFIEAENKKIFLIIRDITQLKEIERMLAIKKEEEKLGKMASYLAHEIKNSLGIIIGYLKLLRKKSDDKKVSTALEESKKLLKMMEDYLNLSKDIRKKEEELMLKEEIERIESSGIKVSYLPNFSDAKIVFDRELLKTIFMNLFKNSKEAGATEVKLSYKQEGGFWVVLYEDNGSGIKEDFKDKVFLPFFTTKDYGSGMGLSIVKKFLTDSGGDIILLPSGKGVKFKILFKKNFS